MEIKIQEEIKKILEEFGGIFPVPIIAIAKKLGIEVLETQDFKDELSGSITKGENGYVIYVNANHSPARKRFTIAHEIGHFFKHKDMIDDKEHIDNTKRPLVLTRTDIKSLSGETKKIETEADKIAAILLMPENEFKKVWQESKTIEDVAGYFGVSQSAATVRAIKLLKSSIY